MGLKQYREKRDFAETPEPRGQRAAPGGGRRFVVQKHAASHLHYDFRLELDGVLKSWAVPKGPSLDPEKRVLAIEVEDHPLEYGDFEGTIPKGQYGGGTVMVWDRGTWKPIGDPRAGYRAGRLKFELFGEKLRGTWNLVRTGRAAESGPKSHWLLMKRPDDFARAADGVTELSPVSVKSGRDLDEIAGDAPPKRTTRGERSKSRTKAAPDIALKELAGAKRAAQPRSIQVPLAQAVDNVPEGDRWLHEVKFDGYRMIALIDDGRVRLMSRNGNDWTERFSEVAAAVRELPMNSAIVDGEIVALNARGAADFQRLQSAIKSRGGVRLNYFLFDLPFCDGFDLRKTPLLQRRAALAALLARQPKDGVLRFSDHVVGNGRRVGEEARKLRLEGIVSKRIDSAYHAGRHPTWRKYKCRNRQEFVIGGFTDPEGTRVGFGALLLGTFDQRSALTFRGRVGTGFDQKLLKDLHKKLVELEIKKCPFESPPRVPRTHWVRPELVAEVEFAEVTQDGFVRQAAFQGLREDKAAKDVVLEQAHSIAEKPAKKSPVIVSGGEREPVGGVALSHPDKVLYPDRGITKRMLAEYYETVAELMLPHVADRPLMLVRCPNGVGKPCFVQKHASSALPAAIRTIPIKDSTGISRHVVLDDAKGLISLAQLGVLEIHTWGARADNVERPDRITIDLDPAPDVTWAVVRAAAKELRELLADQGLQSFAKLTGGKGVHVVAPIERCANWERVSEFCRQVAISLAQRAPTRYIATMSKAKRTGRIFVDYLRNQRGATAIAPYSTRARPGALLALPVSWDELESTTGPDALDFIRSPDAIRQRDDPWKNFASVRQRLPAAVS